MNLVIDVVTKYLNDDLPLVMEQAARKSIKVKDPHQVSSFHENTLLVPHHDSVLGGTQNSDASPISGRPQSGSSTFGGRKKSVNKKGGADSGELDYHQFYGKYETCMKTLNYLCQQSFKVSNDLENSQKLGGPKKEGL